MKKIINGKVYDTDRAKLIGKWENSEAPGDLNYRAEVLYRKKTGEYFLHGEGGARTEYAEFRGDDGWRGGEKIIPLSYEAAREWAEEHLSADEYEAIFGEVVEDDSRVALTLSLSASAAELAKRAAAQQGVGLSAYIESLIQGGCDER